MPQARYAMNVPITTKVSTVVAVIGFIDSLVQDSVEHRKRPRFQFYLTYRKPCFVLEALPQAEFHREILNTDAETYCGSNVGNLGA